MKHGHSHAPPALIALLTALLAACGDSSPSELEDLGSELTDRWFGTSLVVDGANLIDVGTRVELEFLVDGTYRVRATRDLNLDFCESEPDCTDEGTYTVSGGGIVFDPDDDPFAPTTTLTETTLRLFGPTDGIDVDLTFVRPPVPDLIGSWMADALLGPSGEEISEGGVTTTLAVTFEADGTFRYASTFSPPPLFCDPEVSCTDGGTYTVEAEGGSVTFDPDEPDPTVMGLNVFGSSLSLSGVVDGDLQDWMFTRLDIRTPGETGRWYAVSLMYDGAELTTAGASQWLEFDGVGYTVETVGAPASLLCGTGTVPPDCSAFGGYAATVDQLDFTDGLDGGPQSLSMEATPTTLRLFGTIGGVSADFLYARIPN